MQPITNSLIISTSKASRLLLRDFFELETLQNSSRGTLEFCNKSFQRSKTLLKDELQKNYRHIIFSDEKFELPINADMVLLIEPIDGLNNLSKGLPFFSIIITCLKRINDALIPTNSIMIFPALYELYYVEKGGGAWFEKSSTDALSKAARLRISNCLMLENAYLGIDKIEEFLKEFKSLRIIGSDSYNLSLFTAGKLDGLYSSSLNPILKAGFELFVKESGGFNFDYKTSFIAANQKLGEKIKQHFIKNSYKT